MKRLLAVSWALPPLLFPRSLQVARLLAAFERSGWRVRAVGLDPSGGGVPCDAELGDYYEDRYAVTRAPAPPKALVRPDRLSSEWFVPAWRSICSLLREERFDLLVTFGQPWVDPLLGLALRRIAPLPWIAHFSDPWVDGPYASDLSEETLARWRALERDVLEACDAAVFTSAQTVDLVMGKYPPAWRGKAHVLPHAFDPSLLRGASPAEREDGILRLVYTGSLYGPRTPEGLFEAMAKLAEADRLPANLEVHFYGEGHERFLPSAEEWGIAGRLRLHGPVGFFDSLRACAEADGLLLIDAPSETPSPFLPSKLIDYLHFGRPVLGITPDRGASRALLDELGMPCARPTRPDAIAEALADVLVRIETGETEVRREAWQRVARRYRIDTVSAAWTDLFETVLHCYEGKTKPAVVFDDAASLPKETGRYGEVMWRDGLPGGLALETLLAALACRVAPGGRLVFEGCRLPAKKGWSFRLLRRWMPRTERGAALFRWLWARGWPGDEEGVAEAEGLAPWRFLHGDTVWLDTMKRLAVWYDATLPSARGAGSLRLLEEAGWIREGKTTASGCVDAVFMRSAAVRDEE